ncbi:MAG: hypothetical protein HOK81_12080, partial [Rhodospirillaceae bacterium]|nr:hypothetical protein [Rhodospirillaceae bacterium]
MAGRALLASILLIGVLGLSLWLARTEIAERLAIAALEQAGLAPAVLTVEDIGLSGARATAIAIGPDGGPRADSVEIDYSLTGLFSGRAEAVRIEGLDAHGAIDAKGSLSIPALDPVLGGDSSGGPAIPVLPFDRIELEDFALSLETPEGPVVIAGDGNLRVTGPDTIDFAVEISDLHTEWDERVSLKGTVRGSEDGTLGLDGQMEGMIVGPRLSLSFSSMVTGFMAGADLSGKVVFSRLDATTEIFQVEGIAGEIAYENKGEEPQNLSFIFDLPKARLYDRVIGPGHVEAR